MFYFRMLKRQKAGFENRFIFFITIFVHNNYLHVAKIVLLVSIQQGKPETIYFYCDISKIERLQQNQYAITLHSTVDVDNIF